MRADLTDPATSRRHDRRLPPGRGPFRILVNNAGGGGHVRRTSPMPSPAQWGATLDLNLRGPMLATQLASSRCARPAAGRSSTSPRRRGSGSGQAVARVRGPQGGADPLHRDARAGLDGVRVNCVVPDWIVTERAQAELARCPRRRAARRCRSSLDWVADGRGRP